MSKVIIALDFSNFTEVKEFLKQFKDEKLFLKVGMELYYQTGPEIVRYLKEKGHRVFLDLKLHDIPNTVESAMRGLAALQVDMTNVHAAGGKLMMEAARRGIGNKTILIAVTQLTSTSQDSMNNEQKIPGELEASVINYAQLAYDSGLDGVVCSPLEVPKIKQHLPHDFQCVTPGVRPKGTAVGDQVRVTTPAQAKALGSSYIVVGRPITRAKNPTTAYYNIVKEWEEIQ